MKLWLVTSLLFLLFFNGFLPCCMAREYHRSNIVTDTAEEILCQLYIDGRASHRGLYETLGVLRTVQGQISRIRQRFVTQPHIQGAIESLLTLKSAQIAQGEKTTRALTGHLKQIKEALSIALDKDAQVFDTVPNLSSYSPRDRWAVDFLSRHLEQGLGRVAYSKSDNTRADTIRILKTGAFLMVMLSTTADVCVVTGPVVCFALYVAGSGALVVWFTQIYQVMFGSNSMA